MQNRLQLTQLVHAQPLHRRKQRLTKTTLRRTDAAKSAKTQSLVDKPAPNAANPFNLIKRNGLIGVAATKTDQYPSTLSPADAKT
jgi:hypothetical protein